MCRRSEQRAPLRRGRLLFHLERPELFSIAPEDELWTTRPEPASSSNSDAHNEEQAVIKNDTKKQCSVGELTERPGEKYIGYLTTVDVRKFCVLRYLKKTRENISQNYLQIYSNNFVSSFII